MTSRPIQLMLSKMDLPERDRVAPILAAYVQEAQTPGETAELETLISRHGKPGEGATIVSRNLHNAIINWREILTLGVPAIGGAAGAYIANPLLGFLAALTAYQIWSGLFDVKLSEAHSAVVRTIWIDWPSDKPITIAGLHQKLGGPGGNDLANVLDDLATLGLIEFDADDHIIRRDRLVFR